MNARPKPCLRCQQRGVETQISGPRWFAQCMNDNCRAMGPIRFSRLDAIAAWNRVKDASELVMPGPRIATAPKGGAA